MQSRSGSIVHGDHSTVRHDTPAARDENERGAARYAGAYNRHGKPAISYDLRQFDGGVQFPAKARNHERAVGGHEDSANTGHCRRINAAAEEQRTIMQAANASLGLS
jgi:hypothetical protein